MSAPEKIKIVLIGTGGWAGHHARIFSSQPAIESFEKSRRVDVPTGEE